MAQSEATVIIGWIASGFGLVMWLTLVDQIRLNLRGQKGSAVVSCAIVANCTLWVAYGLLKTHPDWPIIISNVPGIVLGAIAAITSLKT